MEYEDSVSPGVIYVIITDINEAVLVIKHQNVKIHWGRGDKHPFILCISSGM
jgi:hypothetical protein